jgi:hypothetical protein
MAWMQPQLTEPPMVSDEIGKIQHRLIFAYPKASLAITLGVQENKVFDSATSAAVINFQHYINDRKLNNPPLRTMVWPTTPPKSAWASSCWRQERQRRSMSSKASATTPTHS